MLQRVLPLSRKPATSQSSLPAYTSLVRAQLLKSQGLMQGSARTGAPSAGKAVPGAAQAAAGLFPSPWRDLRPPAPPCLILSEIFQQPDEEGRRQQMVLSVAMALCKPSLASRQCSAVQLPLDTAPEHSTHVSNDSQSTLDDFRPVVSGHPAVPTR